MRRAAHAAAALALALSQTLAADAAPELTERVEVVLAETVVSATDRKGDPVRDLKPDEIEVSEGGDARRIAFFEPFLSKGRLAASESEALAAPLYDAGGREVARDPRTTVAPAQPSRTIVLAFDVVNSKIRIRNAWRSAALLWVRNSMKPGDRVGVVVSKNVPEWIVPITSDKTAVRSALESLELEGRATQRDRRAEISRLYREISACAEASEAGGARASAAGGGGDVLASPRGSSHDEIDCALSIADPYVAQWDVESLESIAVLRTLSGQLSAIPGRKEAILFSEGIIPDPASLAVNTMLAVFGSDRLDTMSVLGKLSLNRRSSEELAKLHDAARGAGVVFFTFDTRGGAERGYNDTLELDRPVSHKALGANPWVEVYEATSSALSTLAEESGGRGFFGTKGLDEKVAQAAESYFGTYALGFYRPEGTGKVGKLKVRVKRGGVSLEYQARAREQPQPPRPARLDLSIRKPEPTGVGDRQMLPVVLDVAIGELPLRKADGGVYGCQLGIFVQAARPDGTVITETFQEVTAAIDERPKDKDPSTTYRTLVRLDLPPGPYRVRARLSDDRQIMVAERAIDLTLGTGEVRGGFSP